MFMGRSIPSKKKKGGGGGRRGVLGFCMKTVRKRGGDGVLHLCNIIPLHFGGNITALFQTF